MPFIFEAKINTEDRNKLPDSAFGIPSKRKYPLTDKDGNLDEKHVLQAVRFFNKADESDKEELAKNILKAAKKLKMDYSNWKDVLKYAGEVVEEYMTDSWNLEDAKKICMRIHQKADADKHPLLSNQNCQICTWCTEANFRGIDVLPRPIHSPRDPALEQTGEDIIINPTRIPLLSIDNLVSTIKDAGTSRWYCHVKWKDGNGGHEFVYLNYGFEIYLMDSQQGILAHMDDPSVKGYTDDIDWKESYIARMDNKELNTSLLEKYNSMDMFVQWDPKLDIPYMKEHGMITDEDIDVSTGDLVPHPYEEYSLKNLDAPKEANDIIVDMSHVMYDNSSPKTWRLKSPDNLLDIGKGNCHDTTWYVYNKLNEYANKETRKDILFFIEYKDGSQTGGQTHSVCYEYIPGGVCIIECSWEGMIGTFPYENINQYIDYIRRTWDFTNGNDKLFVTKIDNIDAIHSGMTLSEYVSVAMKNEEIFNEYFLYGDGDDDDDTDYEDSDPDDCYCESKKILSSDDSALSKLICEGWKIAGTTINNEYILIQEGYDDISLHVSLVPATINDVPNMEKWEYECMKDAYPNREIPESEVDKLKAELHQDAIDSVHKTRMIQYDGQTIGMLTAYKVLDDEFWFIAEIYLIEEYRGKGIAKYILKNEIDQHDKLILNVYQNNKHAIELYESLGFEITQDGDGRFIMELDKTKHKTIQEGYWQDIKNGVNPKSKKVWFHVSFDDKLDEKGPMVPRIPTWLEDIKKDGYTTSEGKKTHDLEEVMRDTGRYENYTTPRVCFSPSIEGALNSIINMWKLKNKDFPGKQLYVYIPEKPISQYKHKTNKELARDKEVFDAGTTGESWILEPVKVKFYGSIKIDKVKDNGRKHKVLIRPGFEKETDNPMDNYIGRFTYKWHWLIHPSILKQGEKYEKSEKMAQSPLEVCNDIVAELKNFEYGIVKNGKLSTSNNSIEDYNKYYKFMTLDEFEKYRGGICYDYVEWEESYLRDHGKSYKKYYLYADTKYNDTHTFVLVKNDKGFIYIESAFKPIEGVYPVKNLQEALDIITKAMFKMNGNDKLDSFKYYVWEYKGHPEYGSSIKQCDEFYTKGEPIFEGTAINPKKSKGNK